ncbi:hypothetical protein RHMOL_Rhmol09G0022900 [Rhododendron molle]|uniref:Uncharacterized protein n=1 Tax=Rhododendron molle TaxID=49168 RepID=A0ACC0M8V0_RHOML|nr:hypothetical protein RHMOL_Rhmol09G0022900 [Rhododendron molle]
MVGNGQGMFLWLDNWHPMGPLYDRFGNEVVFNLGRSLQARVSFIISQGGWRWPRTRNRITQDIINHAHSVDLKPDITREDSIVSLPQSNGCFSTKSAWEAFRNRFPSPTWVNTVWGSKIVPRWSFLLWLAVQYKLSTRDRFHSWVMNVEDYCVLCRNDIDSHNHLFFRCSFSSIVWNEVRGKIPTSGVPSSLEDVVEWFTANVKGTGFKSLIMRRMLAVAVM